MDQETRKREPLLLATRQRLLPRLLVIDAILEMAKPNLLQRVANIVVGHLVGFHRIAHRALERTQRYIGALGQHENARIALHHHLALAPGPETGNGTYQWALASTGFADDQHLLAGPDIHFRLVYPAGPIVALHGETAKP